MKTSRFFCLFLTGLMLAVTGSTVLATDQGLGTQGRLEAMDAKGKSLGACPLKHTDVNVDIAGFLARVTVRQQFQNPFKDKIEAIYVFPLSQDGAVDRMTMQVGARIIQGEIKERGEARAIFEAAKAAGSIASLLDQERPNIFTQSVANIEPGEQVDITISYSETLQWKDGEYTFSFPMVVGPRYMPGAATGAPTTGWAPPTTQVPDADKISPPVTPEGTRAGHDISVTVNLDAGLPIQRIDSKQHDVKIEYANNQRTQATIQLKDANTIANKDFVLVYETASDEIADSLLMHTDERGKFFTLVLQPPRRVRKAQIVPKEMIFAIDKSGSMQGFPIETAKKAMQLCIEGMNENDTFNLICFEGGVGYCFPKPVSNTPENRKKALDYLGSLAGSGGTEMMKAIEACLAGQNDPQRVRIVCFMTDGYVGNDMAITDAVAKNAGTARVFSFGIGTSVNRYLLDNMARAGRGEVQYILNAQQADGAAERFYERVRMPVLTDVSLDFGNLEVAEVYPRSIPDLFSSTPIVVKGQYKKGGLGTITLKGNSGSGKFERKINVMLPEQEIDNEVLAPMWARAKVEDLMNQNLTGIQRNQPNPAIKEEILGLGLRFQLLTQFTSFVAVEKVKITTGGESRTVAVPVEMPQGVSYEGIFGSNKLKSEASESQMLQQAKQQGFIGASSSNYALRVFGDSSGKPGGGAIGGGGPVGSGGGYPAGARAAMPQSTPSSKSPPSAEVASPTQPSEIKLAAELRGLAAKLAKEGTGGNLTVGKLQIKNGRLEVRVQLADLSDETRAKLKALGFQEFGQARSSNIIIGTIEVAQLDALAKLEIVRHIDPST
jgi:Ca-activated chloride channel homolog